MTRHVHVDADLRLSHEGHDFDVWSEGSLVVVNAPSLVSLRRASSLLDAVPAGAVDGSLFPDETPPIELRVRHATVARVPPDGAATPGVEAMVGVDATVDPRGVLAAAIRALG